MAIHPLLVLPPPELSTKSSRQGMGNKYHHPDHDKQAQRLTPQFEQIINTINTLQAMPGTEPELVLVIETIGNVADFIKATAYIEGLDWLGELEEQDIEPCFDFYDENSREKALQGRLYLVMTNKTAMQKILSLWDQWKTNPKAPLERGLGKFKAMFAQLKSIKQWGIENRLLESGILDDWKLDLQHGELPNPIKCEIELWYRNTNEMRQRSQTNVESLINACGGKVINSCVIQEIAYHSLLVELPPNEVETIIRDSEKVELVKSNNIMFFRPLGQMSTIEGDPNDGISITTEAKALPKGEPIVALLDGYPMSNHNVLRNRLIIDDPDNIAPNYPTSKRKHGTAMASLIVNGDLSDSTQQPLATPLYVRPIMEVPHNDESLPDTSLFVDTLHRAVKRMFEGDGKMPPQTPHVKIINFSIGDSNRPFIREMSPLARLIDWLSIKYKVLFIISAGNYNDEIDLKTNYELLNKKIRQETIIQALISNSLHRRIISPAESINAITVGAAHSDSSQYKEMPHLFDPLDPCFPSPYSAFGAGYRRSIKPEIIFSGGRPLYQKSHRSPSTKILHQNTYTAPGNLVASPSSSGGDPSFRVHTRGTSNAAALTSRTAHECYNTLSNLNFDSRFNHNEHVVPLLKAMLVHGCTWGEAFEKIQDALQSNGLDKTKLKEIVTKWLGYGIPDIRRVLNCTEKEVTLIGFGSIQADDAHYFNIPIPPSLEGKVLKRRLTTTLAWLSPTSPMSQKYRDAKLWFEIEGKDIFSDTAGADYRAVRRGTVQHEIIEDIKAISDVSEKTLRIKINCASEAKTLQALVPYGLLVTLEVGEGLDISIYNEIRQSLATKVRV